MPREIQTVAVVGSSAATAAVLAGLAPSGAQLLVAAVADAGVADADLVIVAGPQTLAGQQEALAAVDAANPTAFVAVTCGAHSVTELALGTVAPPRVLGLRLPLRADLPGVELVPTLATDTEAVAAVTALLEKAGRVPVVLGDRPGQVVTGLLLPYLNQAAGMYEARYAGRDDIDAAMRLGCGLPAGPLQLLDAIGLDTAHDILDAMHARTGDARHAPAPVLRQLAAAGRTGVAAGAGFYTYQAPGSSVVVADDVAAGSAEQVATRPVRTVGVVGSGTMATGIMEVFAKAGLDVVYVARSDEKVAAVRAAIARSLERAVGKGKLTEADRDAALARVSGATAHAALADVDLVVEAVVEDLEVKLELFRSLDAVCRPGAILATTTSSLPVVELAAATSRPSDVVGVHFFNPAAVMKLVEVVQTVQTAPDVLATALEVTARIGKHAVRCGDRPGFIVNALLFPYLNDAVTLLSAAYADADTIDAAVTGGLGYPMGPFALMDVVGLDVTLAIQQVLHEAFRQPGLAPAPLLGGLVGAGYLGRKTKRGFRVY